MSEEILKQIEELTKQIEEQRLQIIALTSRPVSSIETNPSGAATPTGRQQSIPFDASRVPDAIKLIVPYRGDKKNLAAWLSSVEGKLEHAKKLCTTPAEITGVMPLWVSIIRDKIIDEASEALIARHTPCDWESIKQVLTEYFGDKRDLTSLVTQICYLKQGNRNITDFYNECRELLSDIVAKLVLNEEMKPCVKTLSKSYEDMIMNSFIDGLHEPYSTLARTTRPDSLLSAFQCALDQYNATQRRKEKCPKFEKPKPIQNTSNRPQQGAYLNRYPQNNFRRPAHQNGMSNNYQKPQPNFRPPYQVQNNIQTQQENAIKHEPQSASNSRQFRPEFRPYQGNNSRINCHEDQYDPDQVLPYTHYPDEDVESFDNSVECEDDANFQIPVGEENET